jgi:class 3 adenylate cyclase
VIGMASGPTFCGVIGSSDVACRWDIAGPPPVRAARLMQYALNSDICNVAIDQSVYDDPMAFTRLKLLNSNVNIKGTKDGIPVYTLSNCESSVAFRVLETVHG